MNNLDYPAWGEEHIKYILKMTAHPGEKLSGFDDRYLFIDALVLAVALSEDGTPLVKGLLGELTKKWPEAVEKQLPEAKRIYKQMKAEGVLAEG